MSREWIQAAKPCCLPAKEMLPAKLQNMPHILKPQQHITNALDVL
jgi:hypothetical protein